MENTSHNNFFEELDLLINLKSKSFPRIFEYFETPEEFYLVMEHLNGGELSQKIKQIRSLTES